MKRREAGVLVLMDDGGILLLCDVLFGPASSAFTLALLVYLGTGEIPGWRSMGVVGWGL